MCTFTHRQVEEQPSKKTKKDGDKSALAVLKDARQVGCVFQDIEPPECSPILRKSTEVLGPIRRVQFSKATLRLANIRECLGSSHGVIQIKNPHQRSPHVPTVEDRSQEQTERQKRCSRGDAWRMAKSILKLKEKGQSYFFSHLLRFGVSQQPSALKPEERECVVHSGAPMHMLSRKDLNSAELETVRVAKSPTTAVASNGEVQSNYEATVYVKDLDSFVTVKLLEDTPAVLSLGKLSEDHGFPCEWSSGQKPH